MVSANFQKETATKVRRSGNHPPEVEVDPEAVAKDVFHRVAQKVATTSPLKNRLTEVEVDPEVVANDDFHRAVQKVETTNR